MQTMCTDELVRDHDSILMFLPPGCTHILHCLETGNLSTNEDSLPGCLPTAFHNKQKIDKLSTIYCVYLTFYWVAILLLTGYAPVLLLTARGADRSSWPCHLCWPWAATAGPAVHTWWSVRSAPSPPAFPRCCSSGRWPSGCSGMSPRCQSNYYYCCSLRTPKERSIKCLKQQKDTATLKDKNHVLVVAGVLFHTALQLMYVILKIY